MASHENSARITDDKPDHPFPLLSSEQLQEEVSKESPKAGLVVLSEKNVERRPVALPNQNVVDK